MKNVHTKYKFLTVFPDGERFVSVLRPTSLAGGTLFTPNHDFLKIEDSTEPTAPAQPVTIEIDHFADVPERYKFICIFSDGGKWAYVDKPVANGFGWNWKYLDRMKIGELGEVCKDWESSVITRVVTFEQSIESMFKLVAAATGIPEDLLKGSYTSSAGEYDAEQLKRAMEQDGAHAHERYALNQRIRELEHENKKLKTDNEQVRKERNGAMQDFKQCKFTLDSSNAALRKEFEKVEALRLQVETLKAKIKGAESMLK